MTANRQSLLCPPLLVFVAGILALTFANAPTSFAQDPSAAEQSAGDQEADGQVDDMLKDKLCVGVCADQALRAIQQSPDLIHEIKPNVLTGPMRESQGAHVGFSAEVFPRVAPAIVLIRTPLGFGTGFIIDPEGWIVTNEHVVKTGTADPASGALTVQVHLGELVDGFMVPRAQIQTALVHASSLQKDLALLKLSALPDFKLPVVRMADKVSTPGNACLTIGHPTSGLLWTLRTGEVAGVGRWPQEMMQNMIAGFTLQGDDLIQFQRALGESPSRKTMISTVGINPGDSGGPLLNSDGEVIAVNFAVPKIDIKNEVSLDKFSYHVHLDELLEFVKTKPDLPPIQVPPVFPVADRSNMFDKDDDGKFESWVFNHLNNPRPSGVLVDLNDDTPATFAREFAEGKVNQAQFDFEYAFQYLPLPRTFYDTDDNGTIDLILSDFDADEVCDFAISRLSSDGTEADWEVRTLPETQSMRDYSLFQNGKLGERLKALVETTATGTTLGEQKSGTNMSK